MSNIDQGTWRPNWTESEILAAKPNVESLLRNGPWASLIAKCTKTSRGSTWWSRQFDIKSRAAYATLGNIENAIRRLADDAPRVLRLINTQWDTYLARVRAQRDTLQRNVIVETAKQGPVPLYYFLVTDHIQKAWYKHKVGMESSTLLAWKKIGYDNQFLWSLSQFQSTFLGV